MVPYFARATNNVSHFYYMAVGLKIKTNKVYNILADSSWNTYLLYNPSGGYYEKNDWERKYVNEISVSNSDVFSEFKDRYRYMDVCFIPVFVDMWTPAVCNF